ncbi:unnamed protein product [Paramecium sonneborni]|uniref:Uncharacterized protein n=1 Tax=Paramecium sonneborni TaxID=65129 RepID=A0A8S1NXA4_9CILI|nr:unnamed protein product [Paramecium sonneborni]
MNHQGFFGTAIKRNSKQLQTYRGEQNFTNKLFVNDNLRKIQLPKQLTYEYCFSLEQGVQGIKMGIKSPSKQFKKSKNYKQNIENTPYLPEALKISYNQQQIIRDLSPLTKIRRCKKDETNQNQKLLILDQQFFDFQTNKRIRAQSFVEERSFYPDQKMKRPQLNSIVCRNIRSDSFRLQENQSQNY